MIKVTPDGLQNERALLLELSRLDAIVLTRRDEDGELLIRELQRLRARVRHVWPMPDRLPEDTDVVYCDFGPGFADRIPWVPGEPKTTLVAIIPLAPRPDLAALRNSAPDAVLHKPFTTWAVLTSLVMARSQFLYAQRLRTRIDKLDENLRAMRSVERAKAILMAARNIREDEAYNFMRRQAMDRRVSISAIAATIVDSHEILG